MRERLRERHKIPQKPKLPIKNISLVVFLSLILLFIFYFVDPSTTGAVPLFLFLIFLTVYFIFRKLSFAIATTFFLILKYFRIGNIVNLLLIIAIVIAYDVVTSYAYESHSQKSN